MIVIDALASKNMDRISKTIQIADTGIIPGSGVGNSRFAITDKIKAITWFLLNADMVWEIEIMLAAIKKQPKYPRAITWLSGWPKKLMLIHNGKVKDKAISAKIKVAKNLPHTKVLILTGMQSNCRDVFCLNSSDHKRMEMPDINNK